MNRRERPSTRTVPIIFTGLAIGALFGLLTTGGRGASFMLTFVMMSCFVIVVGMVVDKIYERLLASRQDR